MKEYNSVNSDSGWKSFYKISCITTIAMILFFLFDTICWIIFGPYPNSAKGWFDLLLENRLNGILLLSFPTFFGMILYFLTFLGLYKILSRVNMAYSVLAALFAFAGLTILLVTYMAYPIVHLSNLYSVSTTEAQKTLILAAGESKIATTVTSTNIGGFLVEGSALLFSILMICSAVFKKWIAFLGIFGHGLDFIRIIFNLAFLPEEIGSILLMIGGLPQFIWLLMVGIKFFQISWNESDALQAS